MEEIVVHDAHYHTDDTWAVVIASTVFPGHKIVRTRDPEELKNKKAIFCDVFMNYDPAANRFDHHQQNSPTRKVVLDGTEHEVPYSASSLVWKQFGDRYLDKEFPGLDAGRRQMVNHLLETQFMAWHDAHDNHRPQELVTKQLDQEETQAPVFGRNFFRKVELFRPLYSELPISGNLQASRRGPDRAAQAEEDKGFLKAVATLRPLFKQIVQSSADQANAFLQGQAPTPERIAAFSQQVSAGQIKVDLAPILTRLNEATDARQTEVWAAKMKDRNGRPRPELIQAYQDSIQTLDQLSGDSRWKKTIQDIDPALLPRIAVSTGNYYLPLHDLASDKIDFFIAPSTDGGFSLVPRDYRTGIRLPAAWGGLEPEDLRKQVGPGIEADFVHKTGFVGSAANLRSAALMAAKAIEIGELGGEGEAARADYLQYHRTPRHLPQPKPEPVLEASDDKAKKKQAKPKKEENPFLSARRSTDIPSLLGRSLFPSLNLDLAS